MGELGRVVSADRLRGCCSPTRNGKVTVTSEDDPFTIRMIVGVLSISWLSKGEEEKTGETRGPASTNGHLLSLFTHSIARCFVFFF